MSQLMNLHNHSFSQAMWEPPPRSFTLSQASDRPTVTSYIYPPLRQAAQ